MLTAILWSAVATGTLLIGMILAYRDVVGPRWTGLIMAFGNVMSSTNAIMVRSKSLPKPGCRDNR